MSTQIILMVTLFALLGGLANALLTWLNQKPRPPFDPGSFAASFIICLATAFGIAETFNYSGVTNLALAYFAAFLAGMGGQGAIGGIAGAIIKRPQPQPTPALKAGIGRWIPDQFFRRI